MLPSHYLVFLFVGTCSLFVAGLLETGQNVIKKARLVKILDIYPMNWMTDWNCEMDFPIETCQRIRNQQIEIELVYVYTEYLTCSAGWSASSPSASGCTSPCQADSYGENCVFKCSCLYGRNCDPVDGSCDCFDGFTGQDCSTRCGNGEFGPNCQNKTHLCVNRGINHPVSGECLCPNGYRGDRCEIQCSPFTDPLCGFDCELCNRLINTDYCDPIVSSCRCIPGWRGLYCTQPCAPGSSGLFCEDFCCSGNGFCDEEHERCLCLDGYTGDKCQDKCEDGFFGRDCKERCTCPSCHHVTGTCHTCPHGYFGDGCLEPCPPDQWGPSCNKSCACPSSERCDVFTGQCPQESKDGDLTTEKGQPPDRTDIIAQTTTRRGGLFRTTEKGNLPDRTDTIAPTTTRRASLFRTTEKGQPPDRTDTITLTTTRRADEGTTTPQVVVITISLVAVLAIISFILLFAYLCQRRSVERRKTFATAEPPTRVIDDVKHKKEDVSNQRIDNPCYSPENLTTKPDGNPYRAYPPPVYSTLDPATVNGYTRDIYMTLHAESPGYASIGQ